MRFQKQGERREQKLQRHNAERRWCRNDAEINQSAREIAAVSSDCVGYSPFCAALHQQKPFIAESIE
jgi:hypothetical protein